MIFLPGPRLGAWPQLWGWLRLDNAISDRFFTPRVVAERVASELCLPTSGVFRVLDPGAVG